GDVLTGMITSLLAQGYKPSDAARVGVYLHGLTADLTQKTIHPRSFMAGDIIAHIGAAYQSIEKKGLTICSFPINYVILHLILPRRSTSRRCSADRFRQVTVSHYRHLRHCRHSGPAA